MSLTMENLKTKLGPADLKEGSAATKIKRFIGDYGILIFFVLILVFLAAAAPNFLTLNNLVNVVRQSSIIGLIALGMTFIMITAGIDLSVGSVVGLAGMTFALLAPASGGAFWLPLIAGLGSGPAGRLPQRSVGGVGSYPAIPGNPGDDGHCPHSGPGDHGRAGCLRAEWPG